MFQTALRKKDGVTVAILALCANYVYIISPTAQGVSDAVINDDIDVPDEMFNLGYWAFRINTNKFNNDYTMLKDSISTLSSLSTNNNTMGAFNTLWQLKIKKFFTADVNDKLLTADESLATLVKKYKDVVAFAEKRIDKLSSLRMDINSAVDNSDVDKTSKLTEVAVSVLDYISSNDADEKLLSSPVTTKEENITAEKFLA